MFIQLLNYQLINLPLKILKALNFLPIIFTISFFFSSFEFFDNDIVCCMPNPDSTGTDCAECVSNVSSSKVTAKYEICDVKYDRDGILIRDAAGNPEKFCNKHDSQISAMFDRAMSAAEKAAHPSLSKEKISDSTS